MKHLISLATISLFSFFIGNVYAATTIHVDQHSSKQPKIHWLSKDSSDPVEISTDGAPYNLLISADSSISGNTACSVDVEGCQSIAELEPGDSAMCIPTTGAIFLTSECDPSPYPSVNTAAAGIVQFIKN